MTQNIKELHYTTVHNALEAYYDVEIEGSLTRVEYPSDDGEKGNVRFFFTVVDDE